MGLSLCWASSIACNGICFTSASLHLPASGAPDISIHFGRHKGNTLRSLSVDCLRCIRDDQGWSTWVMPANEVLCQSGTRSLVGHHQKGLRTSGHSSPGNSNGMIICQLDPETDVATCASLLRRCTLEKALYEGEHVHDLIISRGYADDTFLNNLLVQMYGKCGSLQHARAVFDSMVHRNLYSWTIMLAACAQNEHCKEALELFGQMQAEGLEPNRITSICVLDACASAQALTEGQKVHVRVLGNGWESDVVVGTALVNMYGKSGSMDDARAVFEQMPWRNVITWNAIIAVCAQNGQCKKALQLFDRMQAEGFEPNKITSMCILDACAQMEALDEGQMIHASVVRNGWESDVYVGNAIIAMYGKCGSLSDARAVFAEMPHKNVVSWSLMITECAQTGHNMVALELFGQMQNDGYVADKITFICVLDACANAAALEEGQKIHASVVSNGWESDVIVDTALVNMYGKCWSLDDASAVFAKMSCRDMVSWSAMIAASAQNGHGREALLLFSQMRAEGFEPNNITSTCALDACASMAALEQGQKIHSHIVANGWEYDVAVGTALVNMYGKCGSLDDARALFLEMPRRDVVSWNVMITACALNGHGKEAPRLFSQMQAEGFEPDMITSICVLDACASVAAVEEGQDVYASVVGNGWESDVVVGTALLNMFGKGGSLDDAWAVFAEMPRRSVISWSAMIAVCAQHGQCMEALQLFSEMQAEGFKPDQTTFLCVLVACSHMGLVVDGRRYFTSMIQEHGMSPLVEHCMCMIDLLGRAGQLDKAEHLIISMPFEPIASAWLRLLSSCTIHGDVERGMRAANKVLELDEKNASSYVGLANIYVTAAKWDDVENLRNIMIDKDVKKVPGCSIDMNNVVHELVVGDMAHRHQEYIHY